MRISKATREGLCEMADAGEMIRRGGYFCTDFHRYSVPAEQVESMSRRGLCRIDVVGSSEFAEITGKGMEAIGRGAS